MHKTLLWACWVIIYASSAQGQTGIFDNCKSIVTDGLKEYSITTDSSAYLNSIFDKYCDSSGSSKSTGIGLGLDAVVKAIPIKLTGNYSSNEEAIRNFCRDYASVSVGRSDKTVYQERIVQRAYESFDQCLALAQTGVVVRHTVRSLETLDFFVAPGFARPVTIRGIKTSSNIECQGQDPTSQDPGAHRFDLSTRIKVQDNNTLNISCTRTGRQGSSGEVVFDEGTVTLMTDIGPNGNYGAFVPRDARLAEDQASSIKRQIDSLEQRLESVNKQLTAAIQEVPDAVFSDYSAAWGGTNAVPYAASCPNGQVAVGLELVLGGTCHGQCDPDGRPVHKFRLKCARRFN
jgi:hypothetical protein